MGDSENLLNIIDGRVLKNIPLNIVYRTSMIVTSVTEDYTRANVNIPGDAVQYSLLNKTGGILSSGDNVIVESTGTNLNNGLIVYKFGVTLAPLAGAGSFYVATTSGGSPTVKIDYVDGIITGRT
jgi:hypothetical protein